MKGTAFSQVRRRPKFGGHQDHGCRGTRHQHIGQQEARQMRAVQREALEQLFCREQLSEIPDGSPPSRVLPDCPDAASSAARWAAPGRRIVAASACRGTIHIIEEDTYLERYTLVRRSV